MMKRVLSVVFAAALLVGLLSVFPVAANATSGMKASEDCVNIMKQLEGFNAIPKWDYSQWTVGFGSRCPDDKLEEYKKNGIPMEDADALMRQHITAFEQKVNAFADRLGLTLTQNQFDALVSMSYNLGAAFLSNENHRVYKAVLNGAKGNDLIFAISVYCNAGGEFLPGLMRRRLAEANMFINGEYDTYAPEHYCYVLYDANGGTRDVSAQGYDSNLPATPMGTATYEGYTFAGWYTEPEGGIRVTALNESHDNMTLYAHWTKGESQSDASTLPQDGLAVKVTADAVNVRNGAGREHAIVGGAFAGQVLTITGLATVGGDRWGKFDQGWLPLEYTNYGELTGDYGDNNSTGNDIEKVQVPVRATVLSSSGVTVYNGPHTTYPKLKTLTEGTEIEITEICTVFDVNWGKCAQGWVQINIRLQLHDNQRLVHPFKATVNYYYLNVRTGPGTHYSRVTQLTQGTVVEILAVEYVDGMPWGRCNSGWLSLDYTDFDESKLEQYREHSYADWYISQKPGCETAGQERRDCKYCDAHEVRSVQASGHSFGDWVDSVASTCITEGQQRRDCQNCDAFETRQTPMQGHQFGQWYHIADGNCMQPGQQRRDCALCGAFETKETEVGQHLYGQWYDVTPATCTEPGQQRRDCQYCDAFETQKTPAAEHVYGPWQDAVPASCTQNGVQWRGCEICKHVQTRDIPMTEHQYDAWVTYLEATCVMPGEERRSCIHCDAFESRQLPVKEHSLGQWYETLAPTADTAGEERRDCEHCDYYEVRELEPTEHSYGPWEDVLAPTCTEPGQQQRHCSHCDLVQTRDVPATGHALGEWIHVLEPDCVTDGQNYRVCENCKYFEREVVPAWGHDYDEWMELSAPTCTEVGYRGRVCKRCQNFQKEELEALGHQYGDWTVVVQPNCAQAGERFHNCQVCGAEEREELPVTEHAYGKWYEVTPAGCGQSGEERRDCANCGAFETREVVLDDHMFGDWYIVQAPACGQSGEERRECKGCGYVESKSIAALEHSYGQWYMFREASCGAEGEARRDCANCGAYDVMLIDALQHAYGPWEEVQAAGCTEPGYRCSVCANCGDTLKEEIPATGHSYGKWYEAVKPGVGTAGEERRDCANCGGYEKRPIEALPGTVTKVYGTVTDYLAYVFSGLGAQNDKVRPMYFGERIEILEQTTLTDGTIWGRVSADTWVCITGNFSLATVEESVAQVVTKLFARVTCDILNVRSGAGTNYPAVGYLVHGAEVEVLEQILLDDVCWARSEQGWFCVTGYAELDVRTITLGGAEPYKPIIMGTVTADGLNIRSGPAVSYTNLGAMPKGSYVEIYEITMDYLERIWGRTEQGWIRLDGYVKLECIQSQGCTEHQFGQWTQTLDATCVTEGEHYRVCKRCGEKETEKIPALGHQFGTWKVVDAGSCTKPMEEARICAACGEVELRSTTSAGHSFDVWVQTLAPGCVSNGTETRICTLCGAIEERTVTAVGHRFGDWYETLPATTTRPGEERRDCANCEAYQSRQTGLLQPEPVIRVYATMTYQGTMNIRSGPGTSYSTVGTLRTGETLEVLEIKRDSFYWIWGRTERGWIRMDGYVQLRAEAEGTEDGQVYAKVTAASVNIRGGVGTNYALLGTLKRGDTVPVYEFAFGASNSLWVRIADNTWVNFLDFMELVTKPKQSQTEATIKLYATMTYKGTMNIRSGPGTGYALAGTLSTGETLEVLEIQRDSKYWIWGRTERGWIRMDGYVQLRAEAHGNADGKVHAIVTAYSVNVRNGASIDHALLGTLKQGDLVTVYEFAFGANCSLWARISANSWVNFLDFLELVAQP